MLKFRTRCFPKGRTMNGATIKGVYADGGVIGRNPSPQGGTWAFCYVNELDARVFGRSGRLSCAEVGLPAVTNNLTELWAMLSALEGLPAGWSGLAYTDSYITLCRFERPRKAKFNGIPDGIRESVAEAVERLGAVTFSLLNGHPTKEELRVGRADRGYPVSIHNVWCDAACGEEARKFRRQVAANS